MVRIAIFLTILLAALVYALRKGGGPERAMALILIAMAVADQVLHQFIPPTFTSVDAGHLAIDLAAAAASVTLALTAYRFWPMLAAVLQLLPLMAHVGKAADMSVHPVAYLTMQVAASWLLPPLLVFATWRHQKRVRANGSDRSWLGSSRRSRPKIANS
ncbi:putative membrane protein [Sphingobium herbicidovorans NBRC 16415]|uniref:Membrane protein n=1 Tax=Sphingobium herbicidovorans (strain ATCC 700291 / DSM 11019 / CCUG 56400 / KCTC 2939 / LMG 18315 / NBRC 16415 / MH) TaxID=1219045 RepID=A0A086P7S9_SPHHM|nr:MULTISPECIES: hypothetical protein [Sphingomonadaceae]KFG89447.1 putative membrane protein [Sphingobium herbicidovorans NBRC 16415]